jgi:hypothetical protein
MNWIQIVGVFAQLAAQLIPQVGAVLDAYRKQTSASGPGGAPVHPLLSETDPLKVALDRLSANFPG